MQAAQKLEASPVPQSTARPDAGQASSRAARARRPGGRARRSPSASRWRARCSTATSRRRGERDRGLPRQGHRPVVAAGVRGVVRRADHRHPQPAPAHRDDGAAGRRAAAVRSGARAHAARRARRRRGLLRRAGSTRCSSPASPPKCGCSRGPRRPRSIERAAAHYRVPADERKGKVCAGARRRQRRVDPADGRALQDVRRGQGLRPQDEPGQRVPRAVPRAGVRGRHRSRASSRRATAARDVGAYLVEHPRRRRDPHHRLATRRTTSWCGARPAPERERAQARRTSRCSRRRSPRSSATSAR